MKIKFGTTPLQVQYTDDELRRVILDYVGSQSDGVGYRDICDHVLEQADTDGKLAKAADTAYQWMQLDRADAVRVSRMLWDEIWARRLFIDFNATHYSAADVYFLKV